MVFVCALFFLFVRWKIDCIIGNVEQYWLCEQVLFNGSYKLNYLSVDNKQYLLISTCQLQAIFNAFCMQFLLYHCSNWRWNIHNGALFQWEMLTHIPSYNVIFEISNICNWFNWRSPPLPFLCPVVILEIGLFEKKRGEKQQQQRTTNMFVDLEIASFQMNACNSVFCPSEQHKQFHCMLEEAHDKTQSKSLMPKCLAIRWVNWLVLFESRLNIFKNILFSLPVCHL